MSAGGPNRTTSDGLDFDDGNQITVERVRVEGSRGRGIVFDAKATGAFIAATGPVTSGSYVDGDVTAAATAGGRISFALLGTNATALRLASSSTANPPRLIVTR